jgi:hypothetical protein
VTGEKRKPIVCDELILTFSTVNRTKQSIGIVRWDIKVVTCLLIDMNRNWNNNIHLFKLNVPN